MSDELETLWRPQAIGHVEARNRIYLPAHQVSLPPAEYGAYLAERARGGVGMIITHGFHVTPASAKAGVSPWQPDWIPAVDRMVGPARAEGIPVFVQITHMGVSGVRRTDDIGLWGPLLAPSPIASSVQKTIPKPMDEGDIEELIEGFATVAANVQEGGADGVELHASHGYLLSNFLSPYWNRRQDAWGGDTERRARLPIAVAAAIRKRCGARFVIGIKLSLDEYIGDAGVTPDEALRSLAQLQQSRLFDCFTLSHTDYHNNHRLIPPASSNETAPLAAPAGRARAAIGGAVPVFTQGSVRDLRMAAAMVARGDADIVGLVRAHIADPDLVRKAREGRADEVRRCVGANQGCWRRLGQPVSCTVNPIAGRELVFGGSVPRPLPKKARRLLVIGGGPAGLKFADTAAAQGHRVSLWERADRLGGQLRYAGMLPDHSSWNFLAQDLEASLRRGGVDLRLNTEATPEAIAAFEPDEVILATGSRWQTSGFSTHRTDRDAIPRAPGAQVLDPLQALSRPEDCGRSVLVIDDNGDYLPLGLARLLSATGRKVTVVTADAMIGRRLEPTLEWQWMMPRVVEAGVAMRTSVFVDSIAATSVRLRGVHGGPDETIEADTVVMCMARSSETALYDALRAVGLSVRRIGDCLAPREVDDAVLEGFREAMA